MAQARRIKPKPKKRTKRQFSVLRSVPWGLLAIIAASSFVIFTLLQGPKSQDSNFGKGLQTLLNESNRSAPEIVEPQEQSNAQDQEESSANASLTEFDYYHVLPDIEQVMPDDLPEEDIAARRDEGFEYYVQAASFRRHEDAESVRAQLALNGITAVTQAREVEGQGLYYRVRVGPFDNQRLAKNARSKLQGMGFEPFVFRQQKTG